MNDLEQEGLRLFAEASGADKQIMNLWLIELTKFRLKTDQVFADGNEFSGVVVDVLGPGVAALAVGATPGAAEKVAGTSR